MPFVSVIIVNFNGGPLLTDCVRSVLASTVPLEVIVSDNRSEDDSLNRLHRELGLAPGLSIIANADNYGFAKANNIALEQAKGDFILFLNPDCLIRPDTIEQMIATMEAHPNAGLAGCLVKNPDGSEQAGCRRRVPTPWRTFLRLTRLSVLGRFHPRFDSYVQTDLPVPGEPVEIEAISGAFMFARRAAVEKVGPMDEGYFMHCEDLDWCMRFRQAGLAILFVPDVEILHVGGVCSASRPVSVEYYKHKGMIRFYRKFFRRQYPMVLMWVVMAAVGLRFLVRAVDEALRAQGPDPVERRFAPPSSDAAKRKVIVTGATSLIGDFLLPALVEAGFEVHAISRRPPRQTRYDGIYWHRWDIAAGSYSSSFGAECLIHLAPLANLPPLLKSFGAQQPDLKRVIAFSSTSRFTKENSGSSKERAFAHSLKCSEEDLVRICSATGIRWTIFRPTLVYNLGRDKNVTTIARFIRFFGVFPLVGEGRGLRQPVHAEDLSEACLAALDNPRTFDKTYHLSGSETLTYREMAQRIFVALGKPCRIVSIPLPWLRVLLKGLSFLPRYQHLTPEMANRINQNMCFDHDDAASDFGFEPRKFFGPETHPATAQVPHGAKSVCPNTPAR